MAAAGSTSSDARSDPSFVCTADAGIAFSSAIRPDGSPSSASKSLSRRLTKSAKKSTHRSVNVTASGVNRSRPDRYRSNRVSTSWASAVKRLKPSIPLLPLKVWIARNARESVSTSAGSSSSFNKHWVIVSNASPHSSTKISANSGSIASLMVAADRWTA